MALQQSTWAWTMSGNGLDELIPYRQDGIEGGLRILPSHGDFAATDTSHLTIALAPSSTFEQYLTLHNTGRRLWHQAQHGERRHGLATPGLAHQPEGFAAPQG